MANEGNGILAFCRQRHERETQTEVDSLGEDAWIGSNSIRQECKRIGDPGEVVPSADSLRANGSGRADGAAVRLANWRYISHDFLLRFWE